MFNEAVWKEGEKTVKKYMEDLGYKIIYTNYSCVGVELDIVATVPVTAQKKELKESLKNAISNENDKKKRKTLKESHSNYVKGLTPLLVITEVKARSNNKFGEGKEAISALKKIHLQRGAEFLLRQPEFKDMQVRIDIASVDGDKVEYIEDAVPCS